jgi:hypothetical protein
MKEGLYIAQQAKNYYQICYHSIQSWDRFQSQWHIGRIDK